MPKSKKKRQEDFQKVKLKVGRKLKREKDTNTDFKVRKIVLKEASRHDPLKSLLNNNVPATSQLKLVYLKKLSDGRLSVSLTDITGEVVAGLSKFLLDNDHRVRAETIKCLKQCVYNLSRRSQTLSPFLAIMMNYVKCGLTHIDSWVMKDCRSFLKHLTEYIEKDLYPQLMDVIRSRLSLSNLDSEDFGLTLKIVERVFSGETSSSEPEIRVFTWALDNHHCDLSSHFIRAPTSDLNISFPDFLQGDIKELFIVDVHRMVEKEFNTLFNRNSWNFTEDEALKLMAAYGIGKVLNHVPKPKKKFKGSEVTIMSGVKERLRGKQSKSLKEEVDAIISFIANSG